jgi:phage protein D/phage baseplate assembly protein gpV
VTAIALLSPTIRVNGTLLADKWMNGLTFLRTELAFGLIGRTTLRFTDPGYGLSTTSVFKLGSQVKVTVGADAAAIFEGSVTGVSLDQSSADVPELVVIAHDGAHKLARGTTVRTFTQVTYSDVVTKMAREVGMTADVSGLAAAQYPYLVQTGSNLAYLTAIVERSGAVWWVDGTKFKVAKPTSPSVTTTLTLSDDLTEFAVNASGMRPDVVTVSGWDLAQSQAILGTANTAPASPSEFVQEYGAPQKGLGAKATAAAADRNPTTAAEATDLAEALLTNWAASSVVARGTCLANAKVALGTAVQIANAGPTSGKYVVTSVEHVYNRRGFITRFESGHIRPAGLVDTLGAAPAASDAGFNSLGLVVGVVTNIHDPDNRGRVKVKFPAVAGDVESDWSRVVVVGAGPSRGVQFHPEVNDEVLVGFEHGDPRRAVVIGGLFTSKASPPWSPPDDQNDVQTRKISSRLGHTIEMGDGTSPDTQHLLMELKSGHKLRLGADRFDLALAAGKPLLIKVGDSSFEIDQQGNVKIEGMAISIKAKQGVTIEGAQVDIKGQAQASLQAPALSVKGSATATVEAGGNLALKGGIVMIN